MAMTIIDKSAQFSSELPVFGNIVSASSLKIGARISSKLNQIDLSDQDLLFTEVGTPQYGAQGITVNNQNCINTNYVGGASSFTIIGCFKAIKGNGASYNRGIAGDFELGQGGVGLYLFQNINGSNQYEISLRGVSMVFDKTNNILVNNYLSLPFYVGAALPAETEWVYGVYTHDHTTGVSKVKILNKNLSATKTSNPSNYDSSHPARNGNWVGKTHKIGALNYSTSDNVNLVFPQYLYHNKLLSDAEIANQYKMDKLFLSQARGIDISNWA